jgi:hypothetical protein
MSRDGSDTTARRPTGQEFALLTRLVGYSFEGASVLAGQLATTLVTTLDENGSLRLHPGDTIPAVVRRRIPVEASYPDADGVVVHVLVHVIDGRLNELEVYREDSGSVLIPPTETDALEVDPW